MNIENIQKCVNIFFLLAIVALAYIFYAVAIPQILDIRTSLYYKTLIFIGSVCVTILFIFMIGIMVYPLVERD